MHPRRLLLVSVLIFCSATCALGVQPTVGQRHADKALVVDGHVVHDLGRLANNVTNWGLIGSRPSVATPFGQAPSARWPDENGVDYLWCAGLWVGGTLFGERLVSTGQYNNEIMASDAPGDTIFGSFRGAAGGLRFPWPGADDDGDGDEDEDPLDGLDNDNDGLTDEDFAAIGDQYYRCAMADDTPLAQQVFPDHTPLHVDVSQRSFQWSDPAAADFIGYEYTVTNVGVADITQFHCGLFSDFDIGAPDNDLAGGWTGLIPASDGGLVPVSVAYMRDGDPVAPAPGWAGWVMCGMATDAAAGLPDDGLALPTLQIFSGLLAFEQGGHPTNDEERYQLLSSGAWDPDVPTGSGSDYRVLIATPELSVLAPGESLTFRVALVVGAGREEMLAAAAEAVRTALGESYDRDGDPSNGDEFQVAWLRPGEAPVAAAAGRLAVARTSAAGVELAFDFRNLDDGAPTVVRTATAAAVERRWRNLPAAGRVLDTDAVGWPRRYDLLVAYADGAELVLDSVVVAGPPPARLDLKATPNPFNPRVALSFTLVDPARVSLAIHDLRGRLVRGLLSGVPVGGETRVFWDGTDDAGQAVASGVYVARLDTEGKTIEKRISLVR